MSCEIFGTLRVNFTHNYVLDGIFTSLLYDYWSLDRIHHLCTNHGSTAVVPHAKFCYWLFSWLEIRTNFRRMWVAIEKPLKKWVPFHKLRYTYVRAFDIAGGHGPLTRYVKLRVAHAPVKPGPFSPLLTDWKPLVSDPACIKARVSRTCRDACRDR